MGRHGHDRVELEIEWIALLVAAALGVALSFAGAETLSKALLALVGLALLARFLYMLRRDRYTVDLIMGGVAILLAIAEKPLEGHIIMALYAAAEAIEELAEALAARRLTGLLEVLPSRITVVRGGRHVVVKPGEVKPGDVILVGRGQVVPVDGVTLDRAVFNTSLVTGETEPLEAREGSKVYSGFINLGDPIRVKALLPPSESSLQRAIKAAIDLVERKTRVQRLIERYAPAYTIALFTVAGAALVVMGVNASISLLIAGCPSAFILTSSVMSLTSVASLAGKGVIVKGGEALERLAGVRVLIFDKTGTLTFGRLTLSRIAAPPGVHGETLLSVAATLAAASGHPLSRSIVDAAIKRGVSLMEALDVREVPGAGLEGRVNGVLVRIGSRAFTGAEERLCGEGEVPVYVAIDGVAGALCFKEGIDQSTRRAIAEVKSMGYRVVLASGDRPENVERVARELGIEEWHGELKPEDKLRLVERARRVHGPVAMVGDGVNDVAAMAAADAGIAVGDVDVVNEIADAALRGGVTQLPRLLRESKAFMGGMTLGFAAAAAIKAAAVGLGSLGLAPLWLVALIGDDGSTLSGIAAGLAGHALLKRVSHRGLEAASGPA